MSRCMRWSVRRKSWFWRYATSMKRTITDADHRLQRSMSTSRSRALLLALPRRMANQAHRTGARSAVDPTGTSMRRDASNRPVATVGKWPGAGTQPGDCIATLLTAGPHLQRPLWSRQIERSYDSCQSVADLQWATTQAEATPRARRASSCLPSCCSCAIQPGALTQAGRIL
jgi:hypothetical protein